MTHGILEENEIECSVDLVVAVESLQKGFVQAFPGIHRHVFWLANARGEMAVHIHHLGLCKSLLHVLMGTQTHFSMLSNIKH